MDYSDITLFKIMKAKMGYHAERQDVLARNVANMDTPGYKPKEIEEPEFHRMAVVESHRLRVRATNPKHITDTKKDMSENYRPENMRKTYEKTPVDNAVVLEEQMMKIAENQMEYQKVTNLYSKVGSMFKVAIGNN